MSANRAFFDGTINSLFETTLNETRLREQPDDDEVTNHKCSIHILLNFGDLVLNAYYFQAYTVIH